MAELVEPITWQAQELIRARVLGITIANGYRTDLGLGEVTFDTNRDPGDVPMTLIATGEVPIDDGNSSANVTRGEQEVIVEFYVRFTDDDNAELLAHRARADLVRALRAPLRGKTPGITSMKVTGSRIGSPEEAAGLVVAQVDVRVDVTETTPASP